MPYVDEVTGLEVMTLTDCVRSLESTEVGRVAFNADGQVHLYPINFVWDGESIVFRTAVGSSLAKSVEDELVFEADGIDEKTRSAWSVLARGVPTPVVPNETPELAARLERLALYPWGGDDKELWFRLLPSPMTGRRIRNEKWG